MKLNMVAVQAELELSDYSSAESFDHKMSSLMELAMANADPTLPSLVCFPEAIGMYLGFVPFYWDEIKNSSTFEQAVNRITDLNRARMGGSKNADAFPSRLLFVDNAI